MAVIITIGSLFVFRQQEEAVVVKSEEGLTKGGPCTPTSRHGARNRLTSQVQYL